MYFAGAPSAPCRGSQCGCARQLAVAMNRKCELPNRDPSAASTSAIPVFAARSALSTPPDLRMLRPHEPSFPASVAVAHANLRAPCPWKHFRTARLNGDSSRRYRYFCGASPADVDAGGRINIADDHIGRDRIGVSVSACHALQRRVYLEP